MATAKRRKKKISVLFSRSKICGFFVGMASFLFSNAENSIAGKIFSSYDERLLEKSLINRAVSKLDAGRSFFRPLKRNVSKYLSRSYLLGLLNGYLKGFLFTKLNVYGLMSVTMGIGFMLIQILKLYSGVITSISFLDTFMSALLVLIAVPLLFSSSTLSESVCPSRNTSAVIFGWLGYKKTSFERQDGIKGHSRTPLPLALVLCVISWWIRPFELLIMLAVLIFALTVFYSPETGVVVFLLCLPFLYVETASVFVIYIAFCFLFKYIRGKRTIKFDPLGVSVLLFAVLAVFSCINSGYVSISKGATVQCLYGVCAFFMFVNLIKSKKWIQRSVLSLSISCLLVSLYGITGYSVSRFGSGYIVELFEAVRYNAGLSYFGDVDYLSRYLITVLPFAFTGVRMGTKIERAFGFMASVSGVLCLGLTERFGTFVCLFAGIVLFVTLYSKRSLALMLLCVVAGTTVALVLPAQIFNKAEFLQSVASAFVSVFESAKHYIGNSVSLFSGTGLGTVGSYMSFPTGFITVLAAETGIVGLSIFIIMLFFGLQKNITAYSKGCSKECKVISLSAISAVLSLLLSGGRVNMFADHRIVYMFWICMGLVSCVSGTERNMIGVTENTDQ